MAVRPTSNYYFDNRNAASFVKNIDVSQAPAAIANVWTYKVSKGRKALVEVVLCDVIRLTTASPVGLAQIGVQYLPNPAKIGSGQTAYCMVAFLQNNTAGANDRCICPCSFVMFEDDQLICFLGDASTGGTCRFVASAKITEFDS